MPPCCRDRADAIELTAANVVSGMVENVGVLVGSVGGGVLLAATGPGGVFLVAGIGLLLGSSPLSACAR